MKKTVGANTRLFTANVHETRTDSEPAVVSVSVLPALVLIVDDEASIRGMLKSILDGQGYRTVVAHNGLEALHLFDTRPHEIKVAVVDMVMPVMNGAKTIRAMRQLRPTLPVILMSGSMESSPFPSDAITAFLRKPFRVSEFLPILRTLLDVSDHTSGSQRHEGTLAGARA